MISAAETPGDVLHAESRLNESGAFRKCEFGSLVRLLVNLMSWSDKNMDYEMRITRNGVFADCVLDF